MIAAGIYRHYKGNEYEVIGVAKHSETEEEHVLYRPLYGEKTLWIRPLKMFEESLLIGGKKIKRFEFKSKEVKNASNTD